MKLYRTKIPLNELITENKILSIAIIPIFNSLFFIVRFFSKLFGSVGNSVVVIFLHRLGDTVFTIPAIREIQKHFGKNINIMCYAESIPVYKQVFKDINFCVLNRDDFKLKGRIAGKNAKIKLKNLNPITIIDLTGSMASASLIFNSKAKKIIGTNGKPFRKIYDQYVVRRKSPHLADMYLDIISSVTNYSKENRLLKLPSSTKFNGRILIHPFAGWKEKEWNLKKFINLAEKLKEYGKVSFLVKGDEVSIDIIEEIKYAGFEVFQSLTVEELVEVINDCSFFIGNDSGPLNIANFLSKPTFTIFGPTNPVYTITGSTHQQYIQQKLTCTNQSYEQYCLVGGAVYCCSGTQCMNLLSVETVYNKIISLIKNDLEKIIIN